MSYTRNFPHHPILRRLGKHLAHRWMFLAPQSSPQLEAQLPHTLDKLTNGHDMRPEYGTALLLMAEQVIGSREVVTIDQPDDASAMQELQKRQIELEVLILALTLMILSK